MAITDLSRGDTGPGSLGQVEGNPRIARIRKCAERMKAHGLEPDSAFAVCTVYEQRGALTEEGRPDAAKIPGGAEMREELATYGVRHDAAAFAEFVPSDPGQVRWIPGLEDEDQPAGGWVENLRRSGDTLIGDLRSLPAAVADAIRGSRIGPRSIEIYREVQKNWRGLKGWALRRLALLGSAIPAVGGLAELGEVDADGNIDGVELFRAGRWPGSAGPIPITEQDLDDMVLNSKKSGLKIPIKLGHGNGPVPAAAFTELSSGGEWLSDLPEGGKTMADETKQTAEKPAVTEAQFAEMRTALEAAKAEQAKLAASLAAASKREAERYVSALFSELSTDAGHGALPIPALKDAGLERLLLASQGFAQFAEGETPSELTAKVFRALHKAGFVQMRKRSEGDQEAADFAENDGLTQEWEKLGKPAGVTLEAYKLARNYGGAK